MMVKSLAGPSSTTPRRPSLLARWTARFASGTLPTVPRLPAIFVARCADIFCYVVCVQGADLLFKLTSLSYCISTRILAAGLTNGAIEIWQTDATGTSEQDALSEQEGAAREKPPPSGSLAHAVWSQRGPDTPLERLYVSLNCRVIMSTPILRRSKEIPRGPVIPGASDPLPSSPCVRKRLQEAQAQVDAISKHEENKIGLCEKMARERELTQSIRDLESKRAYFC